MSSYHQFYKDLDRRAKALFPSLKSARDVEWDMLISPLELKLPLAFRNGAENALRALHSLSRRPAYQAALEPVPGISDVPVKNRSLLMAYDFHSNEDGECFLVEVNTNASGFMLGSLMEMTHGDVAAADYEPLRALREAFAEELKLGGLDGSKAHIAISDEEIEQQKMYPEFLMYRDWLGSGGWTSELCESRALTVAGDRLTTATGRAVDLVYNRLTDFYFEDPAYAGLKESYVRGLASISPNPREYWLLADKQRLIQWADPTFMESTGASDEEKAAIQAVVIPTFDKTHFGSVDQIWAERKNLFFKPKRSFGGKSVYRGESVSRKVFERLMLEDILIQRYQPAQRMPTDDPRSVLSNWKFDLRFYVYGDAVQLCVARIYQGQVTNFSSPMGGFTLVRFTGR